MKNLREIIIALFITAIGYYTVSYFFADISKDAIIKLNETYSKMSYNDLEKYNPLRKYNISLRDLDAKVCEYIIDKYSVQFVDRLSDDAREKAILHLCAQLVYYNIEYIIENDEKITEALKKVNNSSVVISYCLRKYIKENIEDFLSQNYDPFILCILQNVK